MLGRNVACPGGNVQPRGGGSYRGRGGQIMWRTEGGYRGRGGNMGGVQAGPRRDPNAMDVDRGKGGDRTCYVCRKWGHMAKNC